MRNNILSIILFIFRIVNIIIIIIAIRQFFKSHNYTINYQKLCMHFCLQEHIHDVILIPQNFFLYQFRREL